MAGNALAGMVAGVLVLGGVSLVQRWRPSAMSDKL
jgi:hypothetical protein